MEHTSYVDLVVVPEHQCVMVRVNGSLNLEGLKRISESTWSHDGYKPEFAGMVDVRNCRFELQLRDLERLKEFLRAHHKASNGKLAIIADQPLAVGLGYIAKSKLESLLNIALFTMPHSALGFLNLPEESLNLIDSERAMCLPLN